MKEFWNSIKPISGFSYFCLGFILGERFLKFYTIELNFILVASFILSLTILQIWNKKIFYLLIGFSLALVLFINLEIYNPSNLLSKENWEEISKKEKRLKLIPKKQLKKNFFLFEVRGIEKSFQAVFYHASKIGKSEQYECNLEDISLIERENSEYFEFLQYYNHIYFKINRKNCKKNQASDLRHSIHKEIEQTLEKGNLLGESKAIALGLLLGDSSYLSFGLKHSAKELGILHIFAASGLHVGILVGFVSIICKLTSIFSRYATKIIPIFISFGYLWILDFPVSLTRAFFFIFLVTLASLFFRKIQKADLLTMAAFFVLLISREEFFSISFLLSFGAVAGILFFKNILDKLIFGETRGWFVDLITVSLSASIGTLPILVYYFKSYSFGAILINLLVIPLTSFLLPFLYLGIILELSSLSFIADYFWFYSEFQLKLLQYLTEKLQFLGFYREFRDSYLLLVLFFLWVFSLLILYEVYSFAQRKKKNFLLVFIHVSSILLLGSFFVLGFHLKSISSEESRHEGFFLQNLSFAVRKEEELFISGECFYHNYKMKQWIFSHNVKKVWIEKESCIFYGVHLYETQKANVYATFTQTNFSSLFPFIEHTHIKFPKNFSFSKENLIFFSPITDKLSELAKITKTGKGKICLLLSKFSKDSLEDYKSLAPYLGISTNYEFQDCTEKQNSFLSENLVLEKNRIVF